MEKKNNNFYHLPNKMIINKKGVANFFWPISKKEVEEFRDNILLKSINFLKKNKKKDIENIKLNIFSVIKTLINIYIAKKYIFELKKKGYKNFYTGNLTIDSIAFKKRIQDPHDLKVITNGLKKKKITFIGSKLKKFIFNEINYIKKEKINKNKHVITFSNNFLIKEKSKNIKKEELYLSSLQDWLGAKKIIFNNLNFKNSLIEDLSILFFKIFKEEKITLDIKEKKYIKILIKKWFLCTKKLIHQFEKNKNFLPKKIWVGSSGIFYNRVFAHVVKKNGGIVYGFDHGVPGLKKSFNQILNEFNYVDFFYTFNKKTHESLLNNFNKKFLIEPFFKKNILYIKNKHLKSSKEKIFTSKKKKKILYIPRMYIGERFFMQWDVLFPDPVYIDFQIRLINDLYNLNYDISVKPHPGNHIKMSFKLEKLFNVKFCYGNIKKVIKNFDLVIIDTFQTTAFYEVVNTNLPILLINNSEMELLNDKKKIIISRCGYLNASQNSKNKLVYNSSLLEKEIKSSYQKKDNNSLYNFFYK